MATTKVSGAMQESGTKGADIASAATLVVGTDGSYFDITGTTGITGFTVDAGRTFTLQFDGIVTITNGASLVLSGAANFTTEAGDRLTFVAVAADTVVQIGHSLVDGGSPVAVGITDSKFLAKITSGQANVTGDDTVYAITGAIWTETFDTGSDFSNGTFTAPETGKYMLGFLLQYDGLTTTHNRVSIKIVTSNRTFWCVDMDAFNLGEGVAQVRQVCSIICDMDASDTASLTIQVGATSKTVDVAADTSFWGALLG
jgi:hypothetical protein